MIFFTAPCRKFGRGILALALAVPGMIASAPALAALDGDAKSLVEDQRAFKANVVSHALGQRFVVHTMTLPNGTSVREYLTPAGRVFGVSWHGAGIPDFRQTLGVHYADFAASPYRQRGGLAHLIVSDSNTNPNLVVESNGRMGHFHGRAYLLKQMPAGVGPAEVQ